MAKWKYFSEAEFVYNGDWNDSTLIYKGIEFNSNVVLDTIWERFQEYAIENGIDSESEELFTEYCNNNQDEIEELMEIAIESSFDTSSITVDSETDLGEWGYIGDVNPIEHGGLWLKKLSESDYDFVKLQTDCEGVVYLSWGEVDLEDSWIEKDSVEGYGDCKMSENPKWFISSLLDYYSMDNFGETEIHSLDDIPKLLTELDKLEVPYTKELTDK